MYITLPAFSQVLSVGNLYNPDVRYSFNIPIEDKPQQFFWDAYGPWQECSRLCQGEGEAHVVCRVRWWERWMINCVVRVKMRWDGDGMKEEEHLENAEQETQEMEDAVVTIKHGHCRHLAFVQVIKYQFYTMPWHICLAWLWRGQSTWVCGGRLQANSKTCYVCYKSIFFLFKNAFLHFLTSPCFSNWRETNNSTVHSRINI